MFFVSREKIFGLRRFVETMPEVELLLVSKQSYARGKPQAEANVRSNNHTIKKLPTTVCWCVGFDLEANNAPSARACISEVLFFLMRCCT